MDNLTNLQPVTPPDSTMAPPTDATHASLITFTRPVAPTEGTAPTPANVPATSTTTATEDTTPSTKGFKGYNSIIIDGGTFIVDTVDDAFHSDNVILIHDGTFTIQTGDDGIHADNHITINGGTLRIEKCYEGIEAKEIIFNEGDIYIVASDDAINAADGSATATMGGRGTVDASISITVNGGTIFLSSYGDGFDSNGNFTINGGTIISNSPVGQGENEIGRAHV